MAKVFEQASAEYPRPARRPRNSRLAMRRWEAAGLPRPRDWQLAVDDYLETWVREASK